MAKIAERIVGKRDGACSKDNYTKNNFLVRKARLRKYKFLND